jgi:hemoglobin
MLTSHKGMKISEHDWSSFMKHLMDVAEVFKVPHAERDELIALIQTTKVDLVEA